ncbi:MULTISPECIES: hypothetical protein [unclassified Brevibacillus]|uniref:hypothetical protein n=1 Tax=unclassified Brevibacillus TaxID=2684853 RepID=UPI003561D6E1
MINAKPVSIRAYISMFQLEQLVGGGDFWASLIKDDNYYVEIDVPWFSIAKVQNEENKRMIMIKK